MQLPSDIVFDKVPIQKEYSVEIQRTIQSAIYNEVLQGKTNNTANNYLKFSFANTSLTSLASKTPDNKLSSFAATSGMLTNNINENRVNSYSNNHEYSFHIGNPLNKEKNNCFSSSETIAIENGWRQCLFLLFCRSRVIKYTSVASKNSNISSVSPSCFFNDGQSVIMGDYSSTVTTAIVNNRFDHTVDKNNNEEKKFHYGKKKTGIDRCFKAINNACRELWNCVYIRNGKKQNVQNRPTRQLLKKANKQMKREQKATVTLAVVLGKNKKKKFIFLLKKNI